MELEWESIKQLTCRQGAQLLKATPRTKFKTPTVFRPWFHHRYFYIAHDAYPEFDISSIEASHLSRAFENFKTIVKVVDQDFKLIDVRDLSTAELMVEMMVLSEERAIALKAAWKQAVVYRPVNLRRLCLIEFGLRFYLWKLAVARFEDHPNLDMEECLYTLSKAAHDAWHHMQDRRIKMEVIYQNLEDFWRTQHPGLEFVEPDLAKLLQAGAERIIRCLKENVPKTSTKFSYNLYLRLFRERMVGVPPRVYLCIIAKVFNTAIFSKFRVHPNQEISAVVYTNNAIEFRGLDLYLFMSDDQILEIRTLHSVQEQMFSRREMKPLTAKQLIMDASPWHVSSAVLKQRPLALLAQDFYDSYTSQRRGEFGLEAHKEIVPGRQFQPGDLVHAEGNVGVVFGSILGRIRVSWFAGLEDLIDERRLQFYLPSDDFFDRFVRTENACNMVFSGWSTLNVTDEFCRMTR